MDFSKIQSKFKGVTKENVASAIWKFWTRFFRIILFILFICLMIFVTIVWLKNADLVNIEGSTINDVEIQKRKDLVKFRSEKFDKVVERIDKKQVQFESANTNIADIFYPQNNRPLPKEEANDEIEIDEPSRGDLGQGQGSAVNDESSETENLTPESESESRIGTDGTVVLPDAGGNGGG